MLDTKSMTELMYVLSDQKIMLWVDVHYALAPRWRNSIYSRELICLSAYQDRETNYACSIETGTINYITQLKSCAQDSKARLFHSHLKCKRSLLFTRCGNLINDVCDHHDNCVCKWCCCWLCTGQYRWLLNGNGGFGSFVELLLLFTYNVYRCMVFSSHP